MMDYLTLQNIIAFLPSFTLSILPFIFAITVHEVAHGWVAKKYGDNTAFNEGRLTLNPIKHIDLVGSIIVPGLLLVFLYLNNGSGFILGWAKPVPVNPNHFKNPRANMAIVALAGPVSNLLMAIIWALIARAGITIGTEGEIISYAGLAGIHINLLLAIFNLLPIPPLDGSRILSGLLPNYWAWQYNKLERFGFIILIILLSTNVLNTVLGYPLYITEKWFISVIAGAQSY